MQYTDLHYGPGTNALGFGPNRGLGWGGLDPLPGHGPLDVVVNANLNGTGVNVELLGWATGSLLPLLLLVFLLPVRRGDRFMLAFGTKLLFRVRVLGIGFFPNAILRLHDATAGDCDGGDDWRVPADCYVLNPTGAPVACGVAAEPRTWSLVERAFQIAAGGLEWGATSAPGVPGSEGWVARPRGGVQRSTRRCSDAPQRDFVGFVSAPRRPGCVFHYD